MVPKYSECQAQKSMVFILLELLSIDLGFYARTVFCNTQLIHESSFYVKRSLHIMWTWGFGIKQFWMQILNVKQKATLRISQVFQAILSLYRPNGTGVIIRSFDWLKKTKSR